MKKKFLSTVLSLICLLCLSFGLAACDDTTTPENPDGTHTHNYVQKHDDTEHWLQCDVSGCTEKTKDRTAHDTNGTDGTCSVCGYKSDTKPVHNHTWSPIWESDETHHWHNCTADECPVTDNTQKDGYREHVFVGNTCETCHKVVTETAELTYAPVADGYAVTGYTGTSKNVIIPLEHEGHPVVSIGESAFEETNVKYVHVPDSVSEIGKYAFWDCAATVIDLGNGLKKIGYCAFGGCANLTKITIPQSVTELSTYLFYQSNCTNVVIDAEITALPDYTFAYCENLQNVTLPQTVTKIGRSAFDGCKALTNLHAPSVTSVDAYAFYNAIGFDMDVSALTSIGESAFGNSGIQSATVAAATVSSYAFLNCVKLQTVTILDSCTKLGTEAFNGCTALETLHIGNGLQTIADGSSNRGGVFTGCPLNTVTVDANNANFQSVNNAILNKLGVALYLSNANGEIPSGIEQIKSAAFSNCVAKSVVIPDSVSTIDNYAFYGSSVESVHIGKGVRNFGQGIFMGCDNLSEITASSESTNYKAKSNCLIRKRNGQFEVIAGCKNSVIPSDESIKRIHQYAFANIRTLTAVTIPEGVTEIGDYAFQHCTSLETVALPNGLTTLGSYAFQDCGIKNLHIPGSLTNIKANSFYHCSSIESITCDAGNSKYKSDGNCLIDTSAYTLFLGCKNSVVPTAYSIKTIGSNAFCGSNLISFVLPDTVDTINGNAFYDCGSLTAVTIASTVKSIGSNAFYNCTQLIDITFNGTKAQWNAVSKSSAWNYNTGNYTVTCSDGKLDKNDNEIPE